MTHHCFLSSAVFYVALYITFCNKHLPSTTDFSLQLHRLVSVLSSSNIFRLCDIIWLLMLDTCNKLHYIYRIFFLISLDLKVLTISARPKIPKTTYKKGKCNKLHNIYPKIDKLALMILMFYKNRHFKFEFKNSCDVICHWIFV